MLGAAWCDSNATTNRERLSRSLIEMEEEEK
jgi:hypothetical protein